MVSLSGFTPCVLLIIAGLLFYQARALRELANTRKLETLYRGTAGLTAFLELIAGNRELAEIYVRGKQDIHLLEESERARGMLCLQSLFYSCYFHFCAWRSGALPAPYWHSLQDVLRAQLQTALFAQFWESRRGIFPEDFRRCIDELKSAQPS